MLNYHLKVGLLPLRRYRKETFIGIFQAEYAMENKQKCLPYIREHFEDEDTEFVDLDWLNEEGILRLNEDCDRVIDYFREQKIDALFILACNFGNEEAAGEVAKKLRVPTLLWGPRDRNYSKGLRYTDTQCGLFAIGKQLRRNNIPFSYIENCDIEAPAFTKGMNTFLSVACMVKNFKDLRILSVGTRVSPFRSVMYNELELCEKFGIGVVPFNLAEAGVALNEIWETRQEELKREVASLKKVFDAGESSDELLLRSMAYVLLFEDLAKAYHTNIICGECWTGLKIAWGGVYPCLAMSVLSERGIYVICESDLHMAITNALLLSATRGREKPIQGEFTSRHPDNENAELLWHCGPFPTKYSDGKPRICGGKPAFKLKDGEYTIARFQGDRGEYYLFAETVHTVKGPATTGTYMWAEFKNLPALERKMVEGPYIHHMSEVPGDVTPALKEFAKYAGLQFDSLA